MEYFQLENPLKTLPFFYEIKSPMLDKYCPEIKEASKLAQHVDEKGIVGGKFWFDLFKSKNTKKTKLLNTFKG